MSFININMNMEELITAKLGIYKKLSPIKISSLYLKEKILEILNSAEYDIVTCDKKLMDSLYQEKYDDINYKALGLYYVRGKERPKIFLCRDRIKDIAYKNNIDADELFQQVLMHEVGHHVFSFTNLNLNKDVRRYISEGLANYFVYLIGDKKDRDLLEKFSGSQDENYTYYKNFCGWQDEDEKELFDNLLCLIIGDQELFINFYLKYLIEKMDKGQADEILLELLTYVMKNNFSTFNEIVIYDVYKQNHNLLRKLISITSNLNNGFEETKTLTNKLVYNIINEIFIKKNNNDIPNIEYLSNIIPKDKIMASFHLKIQEIRDEIEQKKKKLKENKMHELHELSIENEKITTEYMEECNNFIKNSEVNIKKLFEIYNRYRELDNKTN